jgi:AcrR family transcriptional regulator
MTDEQASAPGRPEGGPREATLRAVLQAASRILDQQGFAAATVEAIAARAGVSKVTIYRWWPNKDAVVMDAFLAATAASIPFPDTGSIRADLTQQVGRMVELYAGKMGRTLAGLIAESQSDPALAEAYRTRWFAARRAEAIEVLERGVRRGELRPDLDLDVAADLLYGPIYHRLLSGHAPLDDDFAEKLVDTALRGLQR